MHLLFLARSRAALHADWRADHPVPRPVKSIDATEGGKMSKEQTAVFDL